MTWFRLTSLYKYNTSKPNTTTKKAKSTDEQPKHESLAIIKHLCKQLWLQYPIKVLSLYRNYMQTGLHNIAWYAWYLTQRLKMYGTSILTTKVADEPPPLVNEFHERIYVAFATRTSNRTTFTKIHNLFHGKSATYLQLNVFSNCLVA